MSQDQDLIVQPKGDVPAIPVILLDSKFVAALAKLEKQAAEIAIADKATADAAASLLVRTQNAEKALEDNRQKVKKPFLDIGRQIDSAAKNEAERIKKIKALIKRRIMDWNAKEQARLRAEEEARQAELRRLQEEKRKQEEEAAKAAAANTIEIEFDMDDEDLPKTELEKKIEDLQYGQQLAKKEPEAPAGIHYRIYLKWQLVDVNKLPDAFLIKQANNAEINRTFCVGYKEGDPIPEVPGLAFEVIKQPIARRSDDQVLF